MPLTPVFPFHRSWRTLLLMPAAAIMLVWLFTRADNISILEHQEYTAQLFRLQQADAELNAAILANRYGLHRNFDNTTAGVRRLNSLMESVQATPGFLSQTDTDLLVEKVSALQELGALKSESVDQFKRETSVLRNSVSYFPIITNELVKEGALPEALARRVGIFGRSVMAYVLTDDVAREHQLNQDLEALQVVAETLPPEQQGKLATLLRHARIILEHKPLLDTITYAILELPTSDRADELAQLYSQSYNHSQRKAQIYRVLLLVVALGLAGYLVLMIIRQRRTARALTHVNSRLNEQIRVLNQTQAELRRYATLFTNASEGMIITDARGAILAVNPAFTTITGYTIEDIAGKTPAILNSGRQDRNYYRAMWNDLLTRGHWEGEIWNRRRNGEIYPEWLSIAAFRDSEGQTTHYIGIFSDVTEQKKTEARIRHLAHHDALTGLPNRLLLQERLDQAIRQAQGNGLYVAVLFFDLDRFKMINDTLGHEVGDRLLRLVTQRCVNAIRETDTIARQGGDEFVVVLPNLRQAQDAALIARKILTVVTQPCCLDQHELTITCSMGIALYPDNGTTSSMLLRHADAAMYRAKANGRNSYQFYTSDMDTSSLDELLLEHQLRGAIERNELCLHYQPKVDAHNTELTGCEALIRWQHPEHGLLPPGRFIPIAEASGLIIPVGQWVIQETCRQLRAWLDEGLEPVTVAVNLSAQQLVQQDIVTLVRSALNQYQIPAQLLELELTETMLMLDVERAINVLTELSDLGVRLAIDDFGTGYSSLAYLRQFHVNTLKIDRSFVHDIFLGNSQGKIATAVIALAHSLGLQVTAEGVETEEQRHFLAAHQCNYLQGYLFGKPEPAELFAQRLSTPNTSNQITAMAQ